VTAAALPLHAQSLGREPGAGVDTFVMIHGYGGSSFSWRHWAPELARRGHVVLVDMKGHGSAPKPDDDRYGPADQAELVDRLIAERALRQVTLVGHSLGGGVVLLTALRLLDAARRTGREAVLKRIVMVAGAAYEQRVPPVVPLARHPWLFMVLMRVLGANLIVRFVLRTIVYDPDSIVEEQVAGYAEPLASSDAVRALIASARRIVPENLGELTARYTELDVPTLLLWGRHDPVVPLAVGERLSRELPRARLRVLEACGHLPAEEHPDESLAILRAFLDGGLAAV
jgi:pimeloyl-ACP methyl ester carboxylesterase